MIEHIQEPENSDDALERHTLRLGNELARQIHSILYANNATIETDEKTSYLVLNGRRFFIEIPRAGRNPPRGENSKDPCDGCNKAPVDCPGWVSGLSEAEQPCRQSIKSLEGV